MRISAREACVKPYLRTRNDIIVYYAPRGRKGPLLTSVSFQYESQASVHEAQASASRKPETVLIDTHKHLYRPMYTHKYP